MNTIREIVVADGVRDHPVTRQILKRCAGVAQRNAPSNSSRDIIAASALLSRSNGMNQTIAAGKRVLALIGTTDVIDTFEMPDPRMGCPEFTKLVLATNGCPYECAWCFLKGTYRTMMPYMAVRVKYDEIKDRIARYVKRAGRPVMFNNGELQDSLALEPVTGAAQAMVPFFGSLENGYLFMLTKSANVQGLLDLDHRGHTTLAWSLNADEVSHRFERGAPSLARRLAAARAVQKAGYPVRLRLDPIVPLPGWRKRYAKAIASIFAAVTPERITIGTLRFEAQLHQRRGLLIGEQLLREQMDGMAPMFPPLELQGGKRSVGKYSYSQALRAELFGFALQEIRRHFDGPVALCKEAKSVWRQLGLDPRHCRCVCQFDEAALFGQECGAVS